MIEMHKCNLSMAVAYCFNTTNFLALGTSFCFSFVSKLFSHFYLIYYFIYSFI